MLKRTYQEHIDWVKERALEFAQAGYLIGAMNSFASDLKKHPETQRHPARESDHGEYPRWRISPELATQLYMAGKLSTPKEMIEFIQGIN